jgi:hypothetical protein
MTHWHTNARLAVAATMAIAAIAAAEETAEKKNELSLDEEGQIVVETTPYAVGPQRLIGVRQ